jgi:hypothetical protein
MYVFDLLVCDLTQSFLKAVSSFRSCLNHSHELAAKCTGCNLKVCPFLM